MAKTGIVGGIRVPGSDLSCRSGDPGRTGALIPLKKHGTGMTNAPDLCRECGGNCCLHPVMTDEEYRRLVHAIGEEKAMAAVPQQYGTLWMFREHCPGKRPDGCVLVYDERPLTCRLYPFVAIPAITGSVLGHEIFLDIRHCPRWKEFGERFEETKQEFVEAKSREAAPPTLGKPRGLKSLFRRQ